MFQPRASARPRSGKGSAAIPAGYFFSLALLLVSAIVLEQFVWYSIAMFNCSVFQFLLTIFAVLVLAPSAFSYEILLSKSVSLAPVENVSAEDIRGDLKILSQTLELAYGGQGVLPVPQYARLIAGLRGLRIEAGGLSSLAFCDAVAELTEEVSDYHLTVHAGDKTCRRQWPAATVGVNAGASSSNSTWTLSFREYHGSSIAVLAIKTMTPAESPEWREFLDAVQKLVTEAKPFIIDLRGNPGRDSTKGIAMARLLYGLKGAASVPIPQKEIYRRRSPEAAALMANVFWLDMQTLVKRKQSVPSYLKASYDSFVESRQQAIDGKIPALEITTLGVQSPDLSHSISFPVFVLVDRHCGSSCEVTLEAMENLPTVQTVGENTSGVVQYGNVGALYLPASHLVVRIATQGSRYEDQRQIEKVGYPPKWQVQPGTDALEFTLSRFF